VTVALSNKKQIDENKLADNETSLRAHMILQTSDLQNDENYKKVGPDVLVNVIIIAFKVLSFTVPLQLTC